MGKLSFLDGHTLTSELWSEGCVCITWGKLKLNRWIIYQIWFVDFEKQTNMVLKDCECLKSLKESGTKFGWLEQILNGTVLSCCWEPITPLSVNYCSPVFLWIVYTLWWPAYQVIVTTGRSGLCGCVLCVEECPNVKLLLTPFGCGCPSPDCTSRTAVAKRRRKRSCCWPTRSTRRLCMVDFRSTVTWL